MPTPAESPLARIGARHGKSESGVKQVPLDRAAGIGERRDVTVLVVELPTRDVRQNGDKAAALMLRYGGRILKREPEQLTALFGLGEPDGRDTELATRCALVALRALDGPRQPSAGVHIGRIHVSAQGEATEDDRLDSLVSTARDLARAARRSRGDLVGRAPAGEAALRSSEPLEGATSQHGRVARARRARGAGDLRSLRRRKDELRDGRRGARRGHEAQGAHAHDPRRPRRGQDAAPRRGRAAPPEGELQRRLAPGDLSAAWARVPPVGHRRDAPGPLRRRRGRLRSA